MRRFTRTGATLSFLVSLVTVPGSGCGGGGSTEVLADPPERPSELVARNDLGVSPRPGAGGAAGLLLRFVQLTDIHVVDEEFRFFAEDLENLIDDFGDAIGFGGYQRSADQETRDEDVVSAFVATINAMSPPPSYVMCTGDSADSGIVGEAETARDLLDGLRVPWLQTVGNHDDMALGVIPPEAADDVVSGDFMQMDDFVAVTFGDRHEPSERVARGHGFALNPRYDGADPRTSRAYYAFDAAAPVGGNPGVRFVVLETTEEDGGANGSIGDEQLRWLGDELDAHPDQLVVVFSHDPLADIDNPLGSHDGHDVARVFDRHPQVIAHVSGHTHIHSVSAHLGAAPGQGFWEVQGSSLIDHPQNGRVFEIASNGDGTGTIVSYVFEQRARGALGDSARISAAAAAQDPFDGSGQPDDRNVSLTFAFPG